MTGEQNDCLAAAGEAPQLQHGCLPCSSTDGCVCGSGRNAQAAAREVATAANRMRAEAAAGTTSALTPLRADIEGLTARRGDDLLPRLDSRLAVRQFRSFCKAASIIKITLRSWLSKL